MSQLCVAAAMGDLSKVRALLDASKAPPLAKTSVPTVRNIELNLHTLKYPGDDGLFPVAFVHRPGRARCAKPPRRGTWRCCSCWWTAALTCTTRTR